MANQTDQDVPDDLKSSIDKTHEMCRAFLFGLSFIVQDTARDPEYITNHLLSYTFQDFLQSLVSIELLVREGIHNACRRELRFILEMAIKMCVVQQQQYRSNIESKLNTYKSLFDSTNISIMRQLNLNFIPEKERDAYYQEVGRIYGETSNYVHWTSAQILERIALVNEGHASGHELPAEVEALNTLLGRGLGCSMVFLLHSVPAYVPGDLLVGSRGSCLDWFFANSRYIALIDEHFDYKHERKEILNQIKETRWSKVTF